MSVFTSLQRCMDRLGGWERGQGDIGRFLLAQALGNALVLSADHTIPKLAATWRVQTTQIAGSRQRRVIWAQGSTAEDLSLFFRSLLDALKTSDAQEFRDNASFGFRTASGDYHFFNQANGFAVRFPSLLAVVVEKSRGAFIMVMSHEPA